MVSQATAFLGYVARRLGSIFVLHEFRRNEFMQRRVPDILHHCQKDQKN